MFWFRIRVLFVFAIFTSILWYISSHLYHGPPQELTFIGALSYVSLVLSSVCVIGSTAMLLFSFVGGVKVLPSGEYGIVSSSLYGRIFSYIADKLDYYGNEAGFCRILWYTNLFIAMACFWIAAVLSLLIFSIFVVSEYGFWHILKWILIVTFAFIAVTAVFGLGCMIEDKFENRVSDTKAYKRISSGASKVVGVFFCIAKFVAIVASVILVLSLIGVIGYVIFKFFKAFLMAVAFCSIPVGIYFLWVRFLDKTPFGSLLKDVHRNTLCPRVKIIK